MKTKNEKKPLYIEIYEAMRDGIVSGAYRYGSRLPSKRELAAEKNVSVITVEHAYGLLSDEGYVESREKSGYFVIYKDSDFNSVAPSERRTAKSGDKTPQRTYEFPYSVLAKTMRRVMLDYGTRILERSPNTGSEELRASIALYLARSSGIAVDKDQIVIGSGAEYLYSLIAQLLGKDRIFALEKPSYGKIQRVYEASGVKCELLKMDADGIGSSELEKSRASVLHVTPFNSFPSGVTAGATKRREYVAWAKARRGYIIEDNYDSEMTVSRKNEDTLFSLSDDENIIYLNTFSQTISRSIRVGYMVLPAPLYEKFEQKLGFYSCTVPVFEQYVLAELISSGDFERHINRVRRSKRKNNKEK